MNVSDIRVIAALIAVVILLGTGLWVVQGITSEHELLACSSIERPGC
ncbi:hypothetical protein [Labrys neptuniae]